MSYKVIKKIKGNLYLYLQKSFRVNGQVKTQSVYLGRAEGKGEQREPAQEQRQAYQTPDEQENTTEAGTVSREAQGANPNQRMRGDPRLTPKQLASSRLKIKINLEKQAISENSLIATFENHIKLLNGLGLDTNNIARIKLKYSSVNDIEPKHKKDLLSSDYKVCIPAFSKGNRTKFWKEYRRAVAKTGLELIQRENPFLYSNIKSVFNESYKKTNYYLGLYVLNSADKNKAVKVFILHYFGIYHGIYNSTMKTEDLGLTDKKRGSWKDEFSDLAGDIIHRGYKTVYTEWQARLEHALNNQKRASRARYNREVNQKWYNAFQFGYMEKANRDLRRAMARVKAQEEALEKIKMIGQLYNMNY